MPRPRIANIINPSLACHVLSDASVERLIAFADVVCLTADNPPKDALARILCDADGCITSWGTPAPDAEILRGAPRLKIVAHAAGSVQHLACDDLFKRRIVLTSAAPAIAVCVAQSTLALIICSLKRVFQCNKVIHDGGWGAGPHPVMDVEGSTIGIIGASHVGRNVMALLKGMKVNVLLYDPHCNAERAAECDARKVCLEELMRQADVVSLHAPITDETKGMITAGHFAMMKDGATFINTARGILIDEQGLIDELKKGRIYACLDVTHPEPPAADNELRRLDNVVLTPHIAGCVSQARSRMGEYAVEELWRFFHGQPQRFQVTKDMLSRIG